MYFSCVGCEHDYDEDDYTTSSCYCLLIIMFSGLLRVYVGYIINL